MRATDDGVVDRLLTETIELPRVLAREQMLTALPGWLSAANSATDRQDRYSEL